MTRQLIHLNRYLFLLLCPFLACSDIRIQFSETTSQLNGPIGIGGLKSDTDYFLFTLNSNYTLSSENGAITTYRITGTDYSATVLGFTEMANFGGTILVDQDDQRVYISDRLNDAVAVYRYEISESGADITLLPVPVPGGNGPDKNQIPVGKDPFGMALLKDGPISDRLLVTTMSSAQLYMIPLDTLTPIDIDGDATNGTNGILLNTTVGILLNQGLGISRIALTTDKQYALITTLSQNVVYVVDLLDTGIEGVIFLDDSRGTEGQGSRDIVVDGDTAYVSSRLTDSIYAIDLTTSFENDIDNDIIEGRIIHSISSFGEDPSGLLVHDGKLFVCNFGSDSVAVIDLSTFHLLNTIAVGMGPTEIALIDDELAVISNFLSDEISVIVLATETLVTTIQ